MMRNQRDLLMSVLRPFIFDPLVDWTVRDKSRKKEVEEGNRPGKEALARVEDRLTGSVATDKKRKGKGVLVIVDADANVDVIVDVVDVDVDADVET